MTEEEKQRGLELQGYIDSIRDMTIKEIAVKHLKKYHFPKFLAGLLVKFSHPLLLAKDYELDELKKENLYYKDIIETNSAEWEEQGQRVVALEKENAELKAFRQDCVKLTEDNVVMARQRAETSKQLIKAKEIINKLIELVEFLNGDNVKEPVIAEAEQFISKVEK